jgi:adenylosuccinate synthase
MVLKRLAAVVGLGFGDEGKGTIVDFLAQRFKPLTIVRHNGGAQAAHNVVLSDGRCHTFAQFGSGSFATRVKTYLSRFMLLNPLNMKREAEHLSALGISDIWRRLAIDRRAVVITPYQRAINRLRRAAANDQGNSSCGLGVGEALRDFLAYPDRVLLVGDLADFSLTCRKLAFLRELKEQILASLPAKVWRLPLVRREIAVLQSQDGIVKIAQEYRRLCRQAQLTDGAFEASLLAKERIVFEGAQGVLLDRRYGFAPYLTPTYVTFTNAEQLVQEAELTEKLERVGVLRAYFTRHGRGPLVTEDKKLTACLPEPHNSFNPWQGDFRVGWFDLVAARYALQVSGGVDWLALTNLDRLAGLAKIKICFAYRYTGRAAPAVLDCFFEWEKDRQGVIITAIKLSKGEHQPEELTRLLFGCQPLYQVLSGWTTVKGKVISATMRKFIQFLEKELATPVGLISLGPTAQDKVLL